MTTDPDTAETDPAIDELFERLHAAGEQRRAANRHTRAGMDALDEAYTEIRVIEPELARLGVPRRIIAETAGVSRAQLYNIITRKTGL